MVSQRHAIVLGIEQFLADEIPEVRFAEKDAEELAAKLCAEKIESTIDKIPYGGMNDPRYRVFVFGTDYYKAKELKLEEIKLF